MALPRAEDEPEEERPADERRDHAERQLHRRHDGAGDEVGERDGRAAGQEARGEDDPVRRAPQSYSWNWR